MPQTAKLFRNGRSQAVRLPADFRFPGSEVYVRRDPATGDVILSRRPDSWQDFFDLVQQRHDPGTRRPEQFSRDVALVGKINAGFDQRRSLDDPRAPVARSVAKQPLQLSQGLPALPIRVGVNQIVETFGLRQIKLAVLERAPGELARLRGPHLFQRRERRDQ